MKILLGSIFGERGEQIHIVLDGDKEWAHVKGICNEMGLECEYSAVKDLHSIPTLNLTDNDKCKFPDPRGLNKNPVWFVSKSGLWKIVARSHSYWAKQFRARCFLDIIPEIYRRELDPE